MATVNDKIKKSWKEEVRGDSLRTGNLEQAYTSQVEMDHTVEPACAPLHPNRPHHFFIIFTGRIYMNSNISKHLLYQNYSSSFHSGKR